MCRAHVRKVSETHPAILRQLQSAHRFSRTDYKSAVCPLPGQPTKRNLSRSESKSSSGSGDGDEGGALRFLLSMRSRPAAFGWASGNGEFVLPTASSSVSSSLAFLLKISRARLSRVRCGGAS